MKLLTATLILLSLNAIAIDCPPASSNGNYGWHNSVTNPPTSSLSDEFRGDNCEDSIYATANKGANQTADFFHMLDLLDRENSNFYYDFSVDFAGILESQGIGKAVDIFELYVLPTGWISPNVEDFKVVRISLEKSGSHFSKAADFEWNINIFWTDVDQLGNEIILDTQQLTFDSDITEGLVHFNVTWHNNNLKGGSANVNVYSNLFKVNPFTEEQETVLISANGGDSKQQIDLHTDHFISGVSPSLYKIGVINPNSGFGFGDGITFYTPYRE